MDTVDTKTNEVVHTEETRYSVKQVKDIIDDIDAHLQQAKADVDRFQAEKLKWKSLLDTLKV